MASSSEKKNYRATLNQTDEKKKLSLRKSHARFDISFEFKGTYKLVRFARVCSSHTLCAVSFRID